MKKVIMSAMLLGSLVSLSADWELHGQISAVNPTNKTITLQGMGGAAVIQVLPYTELKGDDCGPWGNDIYGTFNDLTVGKFVEVEVYPANAAAMNGGMPFAYGATPAAGDQNASNAQANPAIAQGVQFIAKDIEWKCMPRAY